MILLRVGYLFLFLLFIFSIDKFKPGAAGSKLDGVELKIDSPGPNGDGEICFRGRNVFMGYVNEERKTRAAIDDDGWLHTGDIGSVDAEGRVVGCALGLGQHA